MRAALIALFMPMVVAVAAVGQPPASSLALLRVHASLAEFHQGTVLADEDLFVLRDGSVTGSLTVQPEAECTGCGWNSAVRTAHGTAEQFGALQAALTANQIGLATGGCSVPKPGLDRGSYEVTWYGIARAQPTARRTVFSFQVNAGGATCPEAVASLITAIETYASQAGVPVSDLWQPGS